MYIDNTTPQAYPEIIRVLQDEPDQRSRVGETRERLSITVHSSNPRVRMLYRGGYNLAFALQERAAYWLGDNPGHVHRYNTQMERYMEDGELPGSGYGTRLRHVPHDQIERALQMLEERPDTRRAVINIHQAGVEDYDGDDVACTIYLQPFLRGGKLHMFACLRSQDMLWGYPYDTQAFQWIQEMMASALDAELGHYWHRMNSCHYYLDFEDKVTKTAQNYEFDSDDYDIDETFSKQMRILDRCLYEARQGAVPAHAQLTQPFTDWVRVMTAYEQSRFHGNSGVAEDVASRIERGMWRDWALRKVSAE